MRPLWHCETHDTILLEAVDRCPRWGSDLPPYGYAGMKAVECKVVEGVWLKIEDDPSRVVQAELERWTQ